MKLDQTSLPTSKNINGLQMLRAVAAILVVIWHSPLAIKNTTHNYWVYGDASYRAIHYPFIVNHLDLGVDIFFCISGFIMCMLAGKSKSGFINSSKFLLDRAIRILPPYWFFTIIVVIVFVVSHGKFNVGLLTGHFENDFARLMQSLLMIPQVQAPVLGVGWTLIHETFFYLICSLLILIGAQNRTTETLLLISVLTIILAFNNIQLLHGYLFSPYYIEFFIGALAYQYSNRRYSHPELILLVGVICFAISSYLLDTQIFNNVAPIARQICGGLIGLFLIIGVIGIDNKHNISTTWLGKVLMRIGNASYSLYLMHWFVLSALGKMISLAPNLPIITVALWHLCSMIIAIVVAVVFAEKLELPSHQKLKK